MQVKHYLVCYCEPFIAAVTDSEKFDALEFKKVVQDDTLDNVDLADEVKGAIASVNNAELLFLQHGMTPLMHCAYHGYVGQCKELLTKGADVNNYNQKDGVSPLLRVV